MVNRASRPIIAHLSMFFACAFWGLMAPVGKDAMSHGIDGIDLVTFRVCGNYDEIIEKKGSKIERHKELKCSLMNEVVTGKRAINTI